VSSRYIGLQDLLSTYTSSSGYIYIYIYLGPILKRSIVVDTQRVQERGRILSDSRYCLGEVCSMPDSQLLGLTHFRNRGQIIY